VRERRSALAALQARHPALPEQHPARPERHLAKPAQQLRADCPGAVRDASGVAACLLLRAAEMCRPRPAVLPEAQSESAAPLRAMGSGRARSLQAADPVQHPPAAMACRRAQPSARRAQARLQPVVLAQLAVSQPRAASWCAAVPGAWPAGAAAGVRPPEAPAVAEEPRQVAEAVRDEAAAERQPAAARAAAGVQRQAAAQDVVAAVVLQREAAPGAAGGLLRAARGEALAARPSAAAWAVPLCLQAARLAPSAGARFARAMRGLRIALP
jgi:hypothetical protein